MTPPLRLALIMLLMCAGIVVAAPLVTRVDTSERALTAKPGPALARETFVLQADRRSGCVWRVSTTTGRRELGFLPCRRIKQHRDLRLVSVPQVRREAQTAPTIRNTTGQRRSR